MVGSDATTASADYDAGFRDGHNDDLSALSG